jgi:hypothetical protein
VRCEGPEFLPAEPYRFLGHRLDVRSDSEDVLARLRSTHGRFHLAEEDGGEAAETLEIVDRLEGDGELRIEDGRRRYRLFNTGHIWQFSCQDKSTLEFENLGFCPPETLIQTALLTTVSTLATAHDLFHAGVVSMDGAGVVLAAQSGMGKTTLTLELVSRGCGFLSDEIACLDPETGLLEPFPRKVNLKTGSRELLGLELRDDESSAVPDADPGELSLDIEEIAPGSLAEPCPLRYLLFPSGFADEPWLEPLARTNVLFRFFGHAVTRVEDPAAHLFRYVSLLEKIECYNLVVGRPGPTAELILQLPSRQAP